MRAVINKAVEYHQVHKLPGTLIVHPNKGSKNSNYAFERKGLYELSWNVIGPPIPFIDIWEAPGGLTHARAMIQEERRSGIADEVIKAKLQKWVQPNGNPYSERLTGKLLQESVENSL
ncbi:MAG: hypothetical protein LLG04_16340 [Parachlamydia sp.]|nr:hypothetical protein [Parachlamydia sp.]